MCPQFTSLFDPTKAREIYTAESGSSLVFLHFLACHSLVDTKTGYMTLRFASECLLSVPLAQNMNGLLTMLK
jgi:hypothetical protein